jgi:hypothetical protein
MYTRMKHQPKILPTKNIVAFTGASYLHVCVGVSCALVLLFVVWVRGGEVLMRAPFLLVSKHLHTMPKPPADREPCGVEGWPLPKIQDIWHDGHVDQAIWKASR